MIYNFDDIENEEMYKNTRVMYTTGKYPLFNNIVADKLKKMCKATTSIKADSKIIAEFGLEKTESGESLAELEETLSLNLNQFLDVANTPTFSGKWYCKVDYSIITKKQLELIEEYIKRPSEYAVLIVNCSEWKDYSKLFKSKLFEKSRYSNLIKLSFPRKSELANITQNIFASKGIRVQGKVLSYFMLKLSNDYNSYGDIIDEIASHIEGLEVSGEGKNLYVLSLEDMKQELAKVNKFLLDDFVAQISKPIKNDKIVKTRKIYKILDSFQEDYSLMYLRNALIPKLRIMIKLREAINNGYIPITVRYGVESCRKKMGEDKDVDGLSDYAFRKYAEMANLTSLTDWYYIYLIVSNSHEYDEKSILRSLLAAIHRNIYSNDRIINDIGIKNTLQEGIYKINSVKYTE